MMLTRYPHADSQGAFVEIEVRLVQIQLITLAAPTPSRAIAPGTSRYQEKSSPPPDWRVSASIRADRLDGVGHDLRWSVSLTTGGTAPVLQRVFDAQRSEQARKPSR